MNRLLYLSLLIGLLIPLSLSAQDGFSYQAVARDNGGAVLANTGVNLRFQIRETNASGALVYQETHSPTTNDFGLMALTIGEGAVESGDFSAIDWGNSSHVLIVELNGAKIDTTTFSNVPYAKVATSMKLSDLTDVSGLPANGEVLSWNGSEWVPASAPADGDGDPTNEIQTLSLSGSDLSLSNGGGMVTLPTGTTYTSGVGINITGTNIIQNTAPDQTVSLTGAGATSISGTYPNFTITSTDQTNDADSDPNNEIQTLSISGSTVSLSNGGGNVVVPASPWTTSGSDVYYNSGNVGVGITSPSESFHVGLGDDVLFGSTLGATGSRLFYDSNKGGLVGGRIGNYNPEDSIDFYSIAWGFEPVAVGDYSAAFNSQSRAQGNLSFAAGFRTESSTYVQTTFGRYNELDDGSVSIWVGDEPLFVVGNGTSTSNRNNALTLTKEGKLGLNDANPSYFLDMENNDISTRSIFIDHNATGVSPPTQYGAYIDLDKTSASSATTVYGTYAVATNAGGTAYGLYGWANSDATNAAAAYGVRAIADNDGGSGVVYGLYASFFSSTSTGAEYAGYFAGNVFTTGSYLPSDLRLKTGISESPSVLNSIMDLNVMTYEYDRDRYPHMNLPQGQRTGFIAQEVATLMPELVTQTTQPATTPEEVEAGGAPGEEVDFQAVDYAGMVPYLVKALQEQQEQIESLQAEIEALKQQLDE